MTLNTMNDWLAFITQEQQQDYLKNTLAYINEQRASGVTVYPPENDVFNAFTSTPFEQVNVVILGQDPYHGANQAHGLCFFSIA